MDIQEFVNKHLTDDVNALRLKFCSGKSVDDSTRKKYEDAIVQIECRRKFSHKLRSFIDNENFLFPSVLAGEQSSHELVAHYHASLVDGARFLLDMTAGLGVDFMSMAKEVSASGGKSVAIEMDEVKADCLKKNIESIGINNASVICGDSMSYLSDRDISAMLRKNESSLEDMLNTPTKVSDDMSRNNCKKIGLIFADPARRGEGDRRLYDPAQCTPDIIGHWDEILDLCDRILVKNSPMLDIRRAVTLFPGVKRIHVVSVKNECKEVLVEACKNGKFEELICLNISDSTAKTINISADEFYRTDFKPLVIDSVASLDQLINTGRQLYLYEPDSSILKAGAVSVLQGRYIKEGIDIYRLSANCNLLISESYIGEFPGRIMNKLKILEGKDIKSLRGGKYNVVCRNYPLKADMLQKRLKVKPGDSAYIYGVSVGGKSTPLLLMAEDAKVLR